MFSRKQVEENLRVKNRELEDKIEKAEMSISELRENRDSWQRLYTLATAKLGVAKEFVLSRREDIESDIENFGMLKPLLEYFTGSEGTG